MRPNLPKPGEPIVRHMFCLCLCSHDHPEKTGICEMMEAHGLYRAASDHVTIPMCEPCAQARGATPESEGLVGELLFRIE
jgi:hypothetical protein